MSEKGQIHSCLRVAEYMLGGMSQALLLVLVVSVGTLIPLQSGLNATISKHLGHPLSAAVVNFGVGGTALAIVALAFGVPWPSLQQMSRVPTGAWFSGLCGAALVVTGVLAAPRLGAAVLVAGLIAGQLFSSVVLDHLGWVGFSVRPVSWMRIAGVLLLGGGVALVRMG